MVADVQQLLSSNMICYLQLTKYTIPGTESSDENDGPPPVQDGKPTYDHRQAINNDEASDRLTWDCDDGTKSVIPLGLVRE